MSAVTGLIKIEITAFLFVLAALVALQLLGGDINTRGLLCGRISNRPKHQDQYRSPERVQLLVFTLGAALYYLSLVSANPAGRILPALPNSLPALLGGSNAVYLGGKTYARWFAKNPPVSGRSSIK